MHPDGYIWVPAPDHPDAHASGRIPEHRLVAEQMLGRRLRPDEDVHHRDTSWAGRSDNRPENLVVMTHAEHAALTHSLGRWARGYDQCAGCGTTTTPHTARGLCQFCYDRMRRPAPYQRHAWSLHHPACVACGTQDTRHYARGLCVHCYDRARDRRKAA